MSAAILKRFEPENSNQHFASGPEVRPVDGGVVDCEVTEFEDAEGWKQWQDSVFVQDFEDSILTMQAPLLGDH